MNNQPAFPTGIITDDKGKIIGGSNGMSLRDYMAAQAMQGLLSDGVGEETNIHVIALDAYKMANAMMEARNGSQ